MNAELVLVRHAEAVDKGPDIRDLDRELTPGGFRNASLTGNLLKEKKILPDLIITSSAKRALITAEIIAEKTGYDPGKIIINDEVYEASVRTLLEVISQLHNEFQRVLIVGHNPSISYLAEYICNTEIGEFKPTSFAYFKRNVADWLSVDAKTCELLLFSSPEIQNSNQ